MSEQTVPKGSSDTNFTMLIGRMVDDPVLRHTSGGKAVTQFTLATNRVYTTGENVRKQETTYHTCTQWGRSAESTAQYGAKGRLVSVMGAYGSRSYESKRYGDVRGIRAFSESLSGQKTVSVEKVLEAINGISNAPQSTMELTVRQLNWLGANPNRGNASAGDTGVLPTPEDNDSSTATPAPF